MENEKQYLWLTEEAVAKYPELGLFRYIGTHYFPRPEGLPCLSLKQVLQMAKIAKLQIDLFDEALIAAFPDNDEYELAYEEFEESIPSAYSSVIINLIFHCDNTLTQIK